MQLGYSAGDEAFRTDLRAWFEGHYPRFKARWPHAHDPNDLRWRRAWARRYSTLAFRYGFHRRRGT